MNSNYEDSEDEFQRAMLGEYDDGKGGPRVVTYGVIALVIVIALLVTHFSGWL